jgi:hypothetical protein
MGYVDGRDTAAMQQWITGTNAPNPNGQCSRGALDGRGGLGRKPKAGHAIDAQHFNGRQGTGFEAHETAQVRQ